MKLYLSILLLVLNLYVVMSQDTTTTIIEFEELNTENEEWSGEEWEGEEENIRPTLLGININLAKPLGQFYHQDQRHRFGFGMSVLSQLVEGKSIMIGVDFAYDKLDYQSGSFQELDSEGFFRELNYNTNTSLSILLINTRYYFDVYWTKLNPYIEGLIGAKMLSTYTGFTDPEEEDFSDSEWHKSSFSLSYGMSTGVHYEVKSNMFIDLKARYLIGSAATYYTLDERRVDNDIDIQNFKLDISKTDLLYYSSGVIFKF